MFKTPSYFYLTACIVVKFKLLTFYMFWNFYHFLLQASKSTVFNIVTIIVFIMFTIVLSLFKTHITNVIILLFQLNYALSGILFRVCLVKCEWSEPKHLFFFFFFRWQKKKKPTYLGMQPLLNITDFTAQIITLLWIKYYFFV